MEPYEEYNLETTVQLIVSSSDDGKTRSHLHIRDAIPLINENVPLTNSKCPFKRWRKLCAIHLTHAHVLRECSALSTGTRCVRASPHVCVYQNAQRATGKSRMQLPSASERASGNGHFGHGCCHSHVKHNAPSYHYRCVTPALASLLPLRLPPHPPAEKGG